MRSAADESPPNSSDLETDPAFSVVIAYEDLDTGKHARKTYEFLVENLGPDCQFVSQMWKFDVLTLPRFREMAAKDAAMADVIVISSHGVEDLPADVKAWIELWLGYKSEAFALVALFDRPGERVEQIRDIQSYLAGVATRGQMEFFSQPDLWPGQEGGPDRGPPDRRPDTEETSPPAPATASAVSKDRRAAHWGINE